MVNPGVLQSGKWAVADFFNHYVYLYGSEDQLIKTIGCGKWSVFMLLKKLYLMMIICMLLIVLMTKIAEVY